MTRLKKVVDCKSNEETSLVYLEFLNCNSRQLNYRNFKFTLFLSCFFRAYTLFL